MSDAADPARSDPSLFTALEEGIPHPTVGCGGAMVLTPRPGTQFADPVGIKPESASSFYAKVASLRMTWASTLHCTKTGDTNWPGADPMSGRSLDSGSQTTTNYSGYRITNAAHFVQSGWTIPTVVTPPVGYHYSSSGYYASSVWAGIGGGGSIPPSSSDLPLIQAGTRQNILANHTAEYYFWWEIVGGPSSSGEVKIDSPVAHPGDDAATVSIWLADSNSVLFGICDFSDSSPQPNGCVQIALMCNPNNPATCTQEPGGGTVEWIVEAPSPGYGTYFLADFGQVNFYNGCWAATFVNGSPSTCRGISVSGVTSPVALLLQQYVFGRYQILASPGQITSSSSFTDVYHLPDNGN